MNTTQNDIQAKELLDEIKSLKFSTLNAEEFWNIFLKDIAKLHKAPFALLLQSRELEWALSASYGVEEFGEYTQDIFQLGATLGVRALKNGFAYERARVGWSRSKSLMGVAVAIESIDENLVLFLPIEHESSTLFNSTILRLNLLSDSYLAYQKNSTQTLPMERNAQDIDSSNEAFKDVVEISSLLIYEKKFLLAAMRLSNELCTRFECSKVSIGWKKEQYVETIALSHREDFTRKSEVVDKLEALYEECFDQGHEIHYPLVEDDFVITYAHKEYLQENRLKEILSLPLRGESGIKGVILFEKREDSFSEKELLTLRLIANQVTPILDRLSLYDRNIISRLGYNLKEHLSWWLGANDTLIKFAAIVISITLITISSVNMEYKIESLGALSTDNISFVSAPFDATVYEVKVHSGDLVKREEPLLVLDTKELYLKYSEALADVSRYSMEEQKSRGVYQLADMQIAKAKIEQAMSTQQRIEYKLKQAKIVSPMEGVIVEGDHEELLGKPVSKGDMLFKIAQLSEFYLTLNVAEEYINELKVGSEGEFIFLGKTAERIAIKVEKIIPIATVDATKQNSFVIKATLLQEPKEWWRPGMSGVAKINAGERKIIWVLTHKIVDFLRLFFWI